VYANRQRWWYRQPIPGEPWKAYPLRSRILHDNLHPCIKRFQLTNNPSFITHRKLLPSNKEKAFTLCASYCVNIINGPQPAVNTRS
jgi:sorbitol-specific phosphotransferase system component IIC